MAKKKTRTSLILLIIFLLINGTWFVAFLSGARHYDQTKVEWFQLFSRLVEEEATVEEVKAAIEKKGREAHEYDAGEETRHNILVSIRHLERVNLTPRYIMPIIYFDEDGKAVEFEIHTGGSYISPYPQEIYRGEEP